jgi:diaminohydroxyphosphoribosylaminopyrimidine deaminase/5-amino-6-(5-phosphoribosylamino)uracil reductase
MAGTDAPAEAESALAARGVEVFRIPSPGSAGVPPASAEKTGGKPAIPGTPDGGLDLNAVLRLVADRGITRLMVEAGPIAAGAFLSAGLVDEVALLRGPAAIGADGIDALEGLPLSVLTASPHLRRSRVETAGADIIETFERETVERETFERT